MVKDLEEKEKHGTHDYNASHPEMSELLPKVCR